MVAFICQPCVLDMKTWIKLMICFRKEWPSFCDILAQLAKLGHLFMILTMFHLPWTDTWNIWCPCCSLGASQKIKNLIILHLAIPGYEALSEMFQPLCKKRLSLSWTKNISFNFCCTFLVFTGIHIFSVLWVFFITRHLTENQLACSENKLTPRKSLHKTYKIDQTTWLCFQNLSTTCI